VCGVYRGQTVLAELALPRDEGGDIGFPVEPSNPAAMKLVIDWNLWKAGRCRWSVIPGPAHQRYALAPRSWRASTRKVLGE